MAKKDCPVCEGTGWKPMEADGVRRVARCDCQDAERAESRLREARIPLRYEHCRLDSFYERNPSLAYAKVCAQRFVEEYPIEPGLGLLFVGPTGVGKTHLAVSVLQELITQKGVECLFYGFRDLLKEIQDSWNPVSQTSELRVLQPVLDVEVLLLDELAASNPSDWVKETLSYIVNSRYNQKKVTLITTTTPRDETSSPPEVKMPSGEKVPIFERSLEQLGVTMRSRLYEMCKLVEMRADDYRKSINQADYKFHVE